ncbi:MAG: chromate transporter [Lachnospiraceae bacterium]|nr:chromate transporter [Lachnospiraceae bacterium]
MIYLDLFLGFLEVGLFSFGGAYAAIPLIRDVVKAHGWLDDAMLSNMIAISESTPGPLMINMATYVGSEKAGFLGALVATTAVAIPSVVIFLLLMVAMKQALKHPLMQGALSGLKPCIMGIILTTGLLMVARNCGFVSGTPDPVTIGMTLVLGGIYFGSRKVTSRGMSPIGLICVAAVLGAVVYGSTLGGFR